MLYHTVSYCIVQYQIISQCFGCMFETSELSTNTLKSMKYFCDDANIGPEIQFEILKNESVLRKK